MSKLPAVLSHSSRAKAAAAKARPYAATDCSSSSSSGGSGCCCSAPAQQIPGGPVRAPCCCGHTAAAAATTGSTKGGAPKSPVAAGGGTCCRSSRPTTKTVAGATAGAACATTPAATGDDLWVFGYGSLVWKVDFPVAESQSGYIKGFWRRFYQHSIDHRGTPEKPGRVVTLIPAPAAESQTARVFGVAHRIAPADREAVLDHLDHREKNGYVRHTVDFYPYLTAKSTAAAAALAAPTPRPICLYLATEDNESFAGELPISELAAQVFTARGPSGANVEYVYRLAEAMRTLFPSEPDEHLFELERTLRELEQRQQQ